MSSSIYIFNKFHRIIILPKKNIRILFNKQKHIIPFQWQIILLNEGSLTNILNILKNQKIKVRINQKSYKISQDKQKIIRCIWLENSLYAKLIFARSLWILINHEINNYTIKQKEALGISLIKSEIDVYKNINEIYYGYSRYLEQKLKFNGPIWGRKYIMYYQSQYSIIVQEFFSPNILQLFQ